ncbi:FAD-dependent oxidoreductase [Cupriavidus sp. UME77]|uniref:FAD-dependent oxidoreductase n=1 Tax=Cupriavidus sp. UME77 TaxID=1862321 RepID=UPI001603AECF|nr:FAD-dependent oxidoreductase [Cupriavidus sp. UME77]MBB1632202.1 FAD-dependent oxidoreductase [Cupriavidus sp. UME77]
MYQREVHAASLPVPHPGGTDAPRQVVIAGGGPVGLAVALALARHGIPSVVLEADDGTCEGSRAICISRRSLEILDALGAAAPVLDKGLAWTGGRSYYRNEEVLHFTMPHEPGQSFAPMVNIQQYYIEQYLLDAIARYPDLVEIRWQNRVTAVAQDSNGVTLAVAAGDHAYTVRADWLVAADGGRSTVREALGLSLRGMQYEGRYVIVDIAIDAPREVERLAWFDPPSNPGSTILLHQQPDQVWRIDYQVGEHEDAEQAVKPENVLPRVASHLKMMGVTATWEPLWISIYNAKCLTLDSYVHGRALFAGDAAHLVPIFGVRGLNSGFDDAFNLAWKLALAVRGKASPGLLPSYSTERVAAARENMRFGAKSTEFMAPPSPAFALMREAVLGLSAAHAELRSLINPRQTSPAVFADSPIAATDDPAFKAGPAPGATLPDMPLVGPHGTPASLVRCIGKGFTALCFAGAGQDLDDVVPGLRQLCDSGLELDCHLIAGTAPAAGRLADPQDAVRRALDAVDGTLYLVRPDGYVSGRWRQARAGDVRNAIALAMQID